ncbi:MULTISPECIES: Coenzyme F420 hydrogenase/dehydrogenase, beta subunit C-terminal domain [Methanobacterium]|uniref:Coenzyme F420 hydrogenase/dehydrogenase, beta subunit C-terminal domain n=1 Tax=Methanobacterium veterum TaxID=408577 RepID=A0A9E5DM88_9EURY|nr:MULTISPECIES: Coenzyme F420 hydrogenase/dehydrogenase, beta subunit C-terminal domain [Methanobacterium]MCZ3367514.1 Coenzyme F420 hydrogenase/dehydrogenase, beta subunit C-terminal domain [Methanobacterium veterum]MCZ3373338.1 Coenzyme F420 hydrogenase/dehydrogenase, beta subunit C-terminal domain [Methanobacterium veterum]
MSNNTIYQVVKDNLCTGCGTCISLCPVEAIVLTKEPHKGIYIPKINEKKCNNCSICFRICPGHEVNFKELNLKIFGKKSENSLIGNYIECYAGHTTNYELGYDCASGGLITQILIFALENEIINGALITKMNEDNPLEPECFIARTKEEIIKGSKSKYCPVPANIALKEILKSDEEEKFAVVGLPCHIHGVRKAELIYKKLEKKIIIHLGIWCSVTCNFLGTEFILKKYGIHKEEVVQLSYRGKGWPGGMSLKLKNGKEIFISQEEYWNDDFSSFISSRCKVCCDASAELADISFGDYRGKKVILDNNIGKSGIIVRNDIGKDILNKMQLANELTIFKTDCKDISHLQYYFYFKKSIRACFLIFTVLNKRIPDYNYDFTKPKLTDYIFQVSLYLRALMASKSYLWKLLIIYNKSYNFILDTVINYKNKSNS